MQMPTCLTPGSCVSRLTATNISINLVSTRASVKTRIAGTFIDVCEKKKDLRGICNLFVTKTAVFLNAFGPRKALEDALQGPEKRFPRFFLDYCKHIVHMGSHLVVPSV